MIEITKEIIFPILDWYKVSYAEFKSHKDIEIGHLFELYDNIISDIYLGKLVLEEEAHLV